MSPKLLLLFSFLVLSLSGFSQTFVWDGDSDGDGDGAKWADKFNWNLDQVPTPGSIVEIGGDSVILGSQVSIRQLILESNGILYFESSNEEFTVENSTGEGVTINGGAKLYVNGEMHIENAAQNGIDLQANSDLIILQNGALLIENINSDGILGGIGAVFLNQGQIYMDAIGGDGLDLRYFVNEGSIDIESVSGSSVKLSGSIGINDGLLVCEDDAIIQLSSTFTNNSGATLRVGGVLSIASDFDNYGNVDLRNTSGTSFSISTGVTFLNANSLIARTTSGGTFSLANGAIIENLEDADLTVIPSFVNGAGGYLFELDGASTQVINKGLMDLNLGQKMEGFFIENRSVLMNYGEFYLDSYIDQGFFIDPLGVNTEIIQNIDTAFFAVGEGSTSTAVAFEFNTRVRVRNDTCATMVFKDSVAIQGSLGMKLENYGLLEIESFSKKSNALFENEGAVYIADTTLAFTPNLSLIALIDNNGLVYHPLPGPIQENVQVNSVFAAVDPSNVSLFFNQFWVLNQGAGQSYLEAGAVNATNNTWIPNQRPVGEDSVYLFYRHADDVCDGEYFTLEIPIITQGCNSITYTFNENVDNKWNNPLNWTPQGVPSACDHAIIPNGTSCMLVLNYPGFGVAKTLLVEQGAVFQTLPGILFTVDPSED